MKTRLRSFRVMSIPLVALLIVMMVPAMFASTQFESWEMA